MYQIFPECQKYLVPVKQIQFEYFKSKGMGLERITVACQGLLSNYDIDSFQNIFNEIQALSKVRPYGGKFGADDPERIDVAYRIVADHIRTLVIAISDGILPNNTGRG